MRLTWVIVACFCAFVAAFVRSSAHTHKLLQAAFWETSPTLPGRWCRRAVDVLQIQDTGLQTQHGHRQKRRLRVPERCSRDATSLRVLSQGFRTFETKDLTVAVEQRATGGRSN